MVVALINHPWKKRMEGKLDSVDKAVNNQDTGMPTMVQRIVDQDVAAQSTASDLVVRTEWTQASIQAVADHLEVPLPSQPPPVVTAPPRPSTTNAGVGL